MATPEMRAGEGTLSKAATLVNQAQADFNKLSNTFSDTLLGYQSQWQGQGGKAFTNLHQAWKIKQDTIVKALTEFENSLTQTEKDNVNTDDVQSQNLSNHVNRLGDLPNYA